MQRGEDLAKAFRCALPRSGSEVFGEMPEDPGGANLVVLSKPWSVDFAVRACGGSLAQIDGVAAPRILLNRVAENDARERVREALIEGHRRPRRIGSGFRVE